MLIGQVALGELDHLVVDLPPGTGDTQPAQSLRLSGAVNVTTPQDVSLKIARRRLRMFETVNVPILGIIENMSTFTCPHCATDTATDTDVFGHGGGEQMSVDLGVAFLGAIPLGFARRDQRTLSVLWEDGRTDQLDVRDLRFACRCAACVEEMSGRLLLDPATIAPEITPRQITTVGNDAFTVKWSDAHSTGIYTFEYHRGARRPPWRPFAR